MSEIKQHAVKTSASKRVIPRGTAVQPESSEKLSSNWSDAVNHIAAAACREKPYEEIFRLIIIELGKLGGSGVFLIADAAGKLRAIPPEGGPRSIAAAVFTVATSPIIKAVFNANDVLITSEPDDDIRRLFSRVSGTFACVPLIDLDGTFGVLVAAFPSITLTQSQNLAMMAHIAAISYRNACTSRDNDVLRRQIENLEKSPATFTGTMKKSLQDIVHALTFPMEKRDPYTFGHQKRVTRLAAAIAEEMGMSPHDIDGLRLAGAVHDIGKIIIPFEILNRPSYLSEAEFSLIRRHPQVAFEILSPISFDWPVPEIVIQHHERNDGSGYPRGLKSSEILPEARVLAVADVVEAMSSHRPYRAALGFDAALEEVSSKSGILYDPEAVAACIRLLLIKNFDLDGDTRSTNGFSPFTPQRATRTG